MTNLTQAAFYTRKIVKIGGLLIVALLVGRVVLKSGSHLWQQAHPAPPPPPTVGFGKIPKPIFPPNGETPAMTYQLETKQGELPETAATGRVYFVAQKSINLLDLDRARQQAKTMGFYNEPEKVSDEIYHWLGNNAPMTTLEMNINNGSFQFQYDYANDPEIRNYKNLPTDEQAGQEAKRFLDSHGLKTDSLNQGRQEIEYLALVNSQLEPVSSFSEANFVRVKLFRRDLDQLIVLPPNPQKALVSFLFSGSRELNKRIVEIRYHTAPVEEEIFETYPLMTAQQAWEKLRQGKAYLASLGQNQAGPIIIRWVYLAYYESDQPQLYLQPVFVFGGDRNFFAYVPALDPQWQE